MMAEQDKTDEDATNYMAPAEKSVNEILNLDTEDESLRKYKETLLGSTVTEVCKLCSFTMLWRVRQTMVCNYV